VRARPRLFASLGAGAVAAALLALGTDWRPTTRLVIGWDVAVVSYLVLVAHLMASASAADIRRRAAREDEGQRAILILTVAAALASLVAIFAQLGPSGANPRQPGSVGGAITTIFLSWAFVHTMFALHYAHEFYDETAGGLAFPGDEREPDYWDFVYFSFVIGMTSQVSDVAVTARPIRRVVAAHGVIAFVFNVALLALTINLAASAI
jgi:uncharacterized membrane protein